MIDEEKGSPIELIRAGVAAVNDEEYLLALTLFSEAYGERFEVTWADRRVANGLSYFAVSLALVERKYKVATDLCRKAIDLQFYNGRHYENLARVCVAAGKRKKAIEAVEEGLKVLPDDKRLELLRQNLGVRGRPSIPFLDRKNPLNVALGRVRRTKKVRQNPDLEPESR